MRIMIADDDAAIRESLERVLQVEGYDVSTVANGLAVLDGVSSDPPDLVILDVMMPRLGGLCHEIALNGVSKRPPGSKVEVPEWRNLRKA